MTDHHEETATRIAEAFLASLDTGVREQISSAQRNDLAAAIREALAAERSAIADLFETALKQLRAGTDRTELEL